MIFFTIVVLSVTVQYFSQSSSTNSGHTEEVDVDNVISELITEDYKAAEFDSIFDREQHNVLLIVSDDAGQADFGAYGFKSRFTSLVTPTLDNFMGQGYTFKNFHTQPICTPARGSMFTGR